MQSNYRRLGDYIRLVDERNRNLEVTNLVGLTINKKFSPSVANIVDTDMSTYKIIRKNQFACSVMQVRRDKKMPVALWRDEKPAIISQAYPIFEIVDEQVVSPDYLIMWFTRSEFDREACFLAVGGVRGSLEWEDFLNMKFPLPSLEQQKEIVAEYEAVEQRIQLNKKLCEKLEETAQTIYRNWFEDFEFPNEEGKPYKSSGGEMVECQKLGKEIPKGWRVGNLGEICENFDSKRIPLSSFERVGMEKNYPYYGASSVLDYVEDYIFDGTYILLGEDGTVITERGTPILQYVVGKFWVNNHAHVLKATNDFTEESLYVFLKEKNITNKITGAVQLKINQANLLSIRMIIPEKKIMNDFNLIIKRIFEKSQNLINQTQKLEELKSLLLGKMAVEK